MDVVTQRILAIGAVIIILVSLGIVAAHLEDIINYYDNKHNRKSKS